MNPHRDDWARQNAVTIGSVHNGRPPWIRVPSGGLSSHVLGRVEPNVLVDLIAYKGVQETVRILSHEGL